jgi:HD-like signal output (HDOD) protein
MFKKLFPKKNTEPPAGPPTLSPALTASINNFLGARGLPSMPRAAQKAFELSINPDADARDFVEVIQADEALSARIIKIANSVYFDRGRTTETIEQSVFVIGLTELRSLLNANTLSDLFPLRHSLREQFWANAIATAIGSKILAQRVLPERAGTTFLAGLMHDIGKLLMLQRATKDYEQVVQLVREKGISFAEAETEFFVFTHAEVGQLMGKQWNFSDELLSVLRCHHDPWSQIEIVEKRPITVARIVQIADLIAHSLGIGHQIPLPLFQERCRSELRTAWKSLALSDSDRDELVQSILKTYEYESDLYL